MSIRSKLAATFAAGIAMSAMTAGVATAAPAVGDVVPRLSESCLAYEYDQWDSTSVRNDCYYGGEVSIDVWFSDPPCYYLAPGEEAFFRHDGHGQPYFC